MKIRTAFVTNSSSSSYCVEVNVISKKGDRVSIEAYGGDNSYTGTSSVEVYINAAEILAAKSKEELCNLILGGAFFNGTALANIDEAIEEMRSEGLVDKDTFEELLETKDVDQFINKIIEIEKIGR